MGTEQRGQGRKRIHLLVRNVSTDFRVASNPLRRRVTEIGFDSNVKKYYPKSLETFSFRKPFSGFEHHRSSRYPRFPSTRESIEANDSSSNTGSIPTYLSEEEIIVKPPQKNHSPENIAVQFRYRRGLKPSIRFHGFSGSG